MAMDKREPPHTACCEPQRALLDGAVLVSNRVTYGHPCPPGVVFADDLTAFSPVC